MDFNLELIVALSHNGIIGNKNKIPWYIPEDLKHFKQITQNSVVIMGRKTFDSLPNGPLPNRINIVLSRTHELSDLANVFFTDMDNLFDIVRKNCGGNKKVFVIGGSEIYSLLITYCRIIHMTIVHEDIEGDCILPIYPEYLESHYEKIDETDIMYSVKSNMRFQYVTYRRQTGIL